MSSRLRHPASRLVLHAFTLASFFLFASCARRQPSEAVPSATPAAERTPDASRADTLLARQVKAGRALYDRYCALCHAADATGYAADNAPSLVSPTFSESASDAFIAQGILMGRPNTAMAAYGIERGGPLNPTQIGEIVTFLRSKGRSYVPLPPLPARGDPMRGEAVFEDQCRSCHGNLTTRGTAVQLHNPELLASASPEFLRYAIVNGRPPTPMLAFREKLDPQTIEDVLAFVVSNAPSAPAAPVLNPNVPNDLPMVINPAGGRPKFTLREGRFVSADQVRRAVQAKKRMVLVDARSPSDWIQFHIPGAVPLPYYDVEQLKRIPNDGTWVIAYCACPHHASGEVVDALRRLNYPNTAVLDEGILFWRDRGYPLTGEAVGH